MWGGLRLVPLLSHGVVHRRASQRVTCPAGGHPTALLVAPGARPQIFTMTTHAPRVPVWLLVLLAPVMALAQGMPGVDSTLNQEVVHSPLTWAWVAIIGVAAAAILIVTVQLSKHRRPPNRPLTP